MAYPATIFILLGCVIAGRIMAQRALKQLTPDQKVRLLDAFASMRAHFFIPFILILLIVFGLPELFPDGPWWLSLIGLLAFLVYVVVQHMLVARKLGTLDLPGSYKKQVLLSGHVRHIGFIIFLVGVVYEAFSKTSP